MRRRDEMETDKMSSPASTTIDIWKQVGDEHLTCEVLIGACPHCCGNDLIVSDVEISGAKQGSYPMAVHCGGCGARGPWANDEEGAVVVWNKTSGGATEFVSPWRQVIMQPDTNLDDPF